MRVVQGLNGVVSLVVTIIFLGSGLTKLNDSISPEVYIFHKTFFERVTRLWQYHLFDHASLFLTPLQFQSMVGVYETSLATILCFMTSLRRKVCLLFITFPLSYFKASIL